MWCGTKDAKGYGRFTWHSHTNVAAHRASYAIFYGEVPGNMTVDHIHPICTHTSCVNPAHLRLLTREENTAERRARSPEEAPF